MSAIAPSPTLPHSDADELYEIIDGKRTVKTVGLLVSIIASIVGRRLGTLAEDQKKGLVILHAVYRFSHADCLRPDISLVSYEQLAEIPDLQSDPAEPELAPKLVIEVISPTNTATLVEAKIFKYFATGVEVVWVVYPAQKRIHIYESPHACTILGVGDTLDGGKVFPGFSMPVAEVFDIPKPQE